MAKQDKKSPVVINKDKFLLPKMEWIELDGATGEGFYVRELGGDGLLAFKELAEEIEKSGEIQPSQAFDLMTKFIIMSACDERGNLIFTDDDFGLLRAKNPNLLMDIANKAMPLSGLQLTGVEVAANLKNDLQDSSTTD